MARAAGLLAAALLAGGAISGAASAQHAGLGASTSGSAAAYSPPGHRVGSAYNGGFRRGFRHRGHFGAERAFGYGGFVGYGDYAAGFAPDESEYSGSDWGFFDGQGDVRTSGGKAVYSYDRSYPYDWYPGPGPRSPARRLAMRAPSPRAVHCESQHSVRVCRGD